jgi:hypothetical protein
MDSNPASAVINHLGRCLALQSEGEFPMQLQPPSRREILPDYILDDPVGAAESSPIFHQQLALAEDVQHTHRAQT